MSARQPSGERVWVGTYPRGGPEGEPGTGEGVWSVDRTREGALSATLAAPSPAPSFLALSSDGAQLYAVGETPSGTVARFTVSPDGDLTEVERVASGGDGPCHLLLTDAALYVANYSSGSVGVLTLDGTGAFSAEVVDAGGPVQVMQHDGSGPDADRQEGPHAHSTLRVGEVLLAADLGTDELRRYRVRGDGRLSADGVAYRFEPGTGPRHMARGAGDHLYVVGELDARLHVLAWEPERGALQEVQVLPACRSPLTPGSTMLPAHIEARGAEVLLSVRGADVIAHFAVHDDGARLAHVVDVSVGGGWPRHFALLDDGLVVAVQNGGSVTLLDRRGRGVGVVIDHPACVVRAPHPLGG